VRHRGRDLLAGVALLGPVVGFGLGAAASPTPSPQIATIVERAQQAADDAVYLPVRVHGRWVLSGPMRAWLQPSISLISTPWRWAPERCAVLDPSLGPGMRSFMLGQIHRLFAGSLADSLTTQFSERLTSVTLPDCINPNRSASGPPGPIIDRTAVGGVRAKGHEIVVHAQVNVDDWQSGVSHTATPGNGRRIGWRLVRGLLDSSYTLARADTSWKVVAMSWAFAPGHSP
jgi:hypothetical protein